MGEKRIENQQLLVVNDPDKWVSIFADDNFPMKVKSVRGKKKKKIRINMSDTLP